MRSLDGDLLCEWLEEKEKRMRKECRNELWMDGMEGSEGSCQHLYAPAAWPNMESHQKLRAYLYLNHAKLAESIAKKRKEKGNGEKEKRKENEENVGSGHKSR